MQQNHYDYAYFALFPTSFPDPGAISNQCSKIHCCEPDQCPPLVPGGCLQMVREVYLSEAVLGWISGGCTHTKRASGMWRPRVTIGCIQTPLGQTTGSVPKPAA